MQSEWREVSLKDAAQWLSGGTPSKFKPEYWGGDIPWISAKSMSGNRYSDSELKLTEAGLQNGSRLAPKDSTLLLVRGSMLHQRIPVGIATRDVAFNQDVKAIIPNQDFLPLYFFYCFAAREQELLAKVENTSIGAGKLDTDVLHKLTIFCPPLSEQKAIADFLGSLDDKIELNRQMNATLEAMAQALFKSWFVDFDPVLDNALAAGNPIPDELAHKAAAREALGDACKPLPEDIAALFPAAFVWTEEMGWIPEGWEVLPVSMAIQINPKVTIKKNQVAPFVDMKALPTSGYATDEVGEKAFSGGAKFNNEDVLLARITPCLENGKTGIVDFLLKDEVGFGSTEFIVMRGKAEIKMPFVACLARDETFRQHCIQHMVGSSGRQRVQNACFDSFYLALPKTGKVLKTFNDVAVGNFHKISQLKGESAALTQLRDTLLPKLLSGELRIPDAEKWVGDAL